MDTTKPYISAANGKAVAHAADLLKEGKLVAFPTETVYGLGADATNGKAVARIFEAKGRPQFNPLIIHVPDVTAVERLVIMDDRAQAVADKFWPGPLTLILPRLEDCPVSELCSAGLPTLAVRVPGHKAAQDLLQEVGCPVAAPSANRSGSISPTTPLHVSESLGCAVDMILAAGPCTVGLESTVLDLSGGEPLILRPGAITAEDLEAVLGSLPSYDVGNHDKPKSPGQLLRHYAPSIPLRLNAIDIEPGEALLAFGPIKFMGVRGGGAVNDLAEHALRNLSTQSDLEEAAANLFRMLNELDCSDNERIAVMAIPEVGLGIAINDRLRRAAAGSVSP